MACVHCGSMLEEDEKTSGVCGRCKLGGKKPKPAVDIFKTRSAAPVAKAAEKPKPKARLVIPAGPAKILLIDDEPLLVKLLKKRLEASGYLVVTAADGKQGYQMIKTEKPELILTDLMMPEMTGYDLVQKLKKAADGTQHIPVIVITAKGGMARFFSDWEIHGFLTKPIDPVELLSKAEELIELGRRRRERES